MANKLRATLLATTALGFLFCGSAQAADMSTDQAIKAMQAQIESLQKQLSQIQNSTKASSAASASTPASDKKEILPGVSFKFGGYLATEAVWRDKNQTDSVGSSNNTGIPFANARNAHHDEFRGSVQETRLNVLAQGKPDSDTSVAGFLEFDLSGAAATSTATKTNSYVPRLRHAYVTVESEEMGSSVLVGQAFSLATPFREKLAAGKEVGIYTIDKTGVAGFVYTRAPSIRFVKSFADKKANFGLAFETGQTYTGGITTPAGVAISNTGGAGFGGVGTYSFDYAPDAIAKLAYDSSFGHYEIYGMTRFFRDIVGTTNFHKNYAIGFSGGASGFVSLLPKKLDLAANFTAGNAIGRYSAAMMPDLAFTPSGDIKPMTQLTGLVGLIAHPTTTLDAYLYAGAEKVMRQDYGNTTYGYGSSLIDNSGCYTAGGTCNAQTEMVMQISTGFWSSLYKGEYGSMKAGAQYSLARRTAFSGLNNKTPHADENSVMVSFRYSPF